MITSDMVPDEAVVAALQTEEYVGMRSVIAAALNAWPGSDYVCRQPHRRSVSYSNPAIILPLPQEDEQMSKSEQVLELEYQIDHQYAEIFRLQRRVKKQEEEISRLRHAREILHKADLLVRGRALEEAAKVCDEREHANLYGVKECAAAIRSLKEKP